MKLPIRNYLSTPLTIFIEPYCDQYEVPPGGEAAITLEDGHPHSIDIHPDQWVSVWNEGPQIASVEVFSEHQFSSPSIPETPLDTILWKLRALSDRPDRIRGADTEIYYDTRLVGEDGWELIAHLTERFHTDFSTMNAGDYIPHEGVDLRTLWGLLGRRPFKSLTAGRLVQAVEMGRWEENLDGSLPTGR